VAANPERERFLRHVRQRGLRLTRERTALFDEIFAQHGHLDAEALLRSMKGRGIKTSRATVYRNLDLLVECGVVRKHQLGGSRHVYEHVHVGQRHDHLFCRECGRVVEFVSPGIEAMQNEICRAHGFEPNVHSLQITGLCRECGSRSAGARTSPAAEEARRGLSRP
jgi:Fur family ferric uptake transcriptional regulator